MFTTGAVLVNAGDVLSAELVIRMQALAAEGVLTPDSIRVVSDPLAAAVE